MDKQLINMDKPPSSLIKNENIIIEKHINYLYSLVIFADSIKNRVLPVLAGSYSHLSAFYEGINKV